VVEKAPVWIDEREENLGWKEVNASQGERRFEQRKDGREDLPLVGSELKRDSNIAVGRRGGIGWVVKSAVDVGGRRK